MAALRTQIYLTRDQRRELDVIAAREGASLAELIRDAVDRYLQERPLDPDAALEATFGACTTAGAATRDEWQGREQRTSIG